ncbi:defensin-like protein 17 [Senna tora]|uniref:Defensin-like protein 17 n=1 Tax=Senna tora TaxID=362788 RepID=A0A834X324_9FABA|nr:defensin-like protein 17 [Senna tora]
MATYFFKLSTFMAAFFCLALLLFPYTEAEALCGKPSGTFRGPCFSSSGCSEQCRSQENAIGGACYVLACYCHYPCH